MAVLLTGGAGYIGSHAAVALISSGFDVVCLDNFSNSRPETIDHVQEISKRQFPLIVGDIRDPAVLDRVFSDYQIDAVIHFAGLKSVSEAVQKPAIYYDNNIVGTLNLLNAMAGAKVKNLVFSSSATVYGQPAYLPIDESHPTSVTNPYGRTKLMLEEILHDFVVADPDWRIAVLRYFNPVGAHASGLIGEDPNGIPNNLMPFISRVASGRLERLSIFGNDYDTIDGTGVRDFIHVEDLASGHVCALKALAVLEVPVATWNLGTGQGYSVLEMVRAFERVNGVAVPYQFAPRRVGDVASCYASPEKALRELGWKATLGLEAMCESVWKFERSRASGR
jgi:UDP-glucose 4-epimerase